MPISLPHEGMYESLQTLFWPKSNFISKGRMEFHVSCLLAKHEIAKDDVLASGTDRRDVMLLNSLIDASC